MSRAVRCYYRPVDMCYLMRHKGAMRRAREFREWPSATRVLRAGSAAARNCEGFGESHACIKSGCQGARRDRAVLGMVEVGGGWSLVLVRA